MISFLLKRNMVNTLRNSLIIIVFFSDGKTVYTVK